MAEYHIHRESGGTWVFLSYYWFGSFPSGYWFRIDEWASTTGYANVDVLAGTVADTNRHTIPHLAFRSSFLQHSIPSLNDTQRLFMIEYSLMHVLDWIGHLWAQYTTRAPAIALMHTTGTPIAELGPIPEFAAYVERIACKCILDSKMAPPVRFKAAMMQSQDNDNDPEQFQDGGRFGKPFDPDAFDKTV
ncbi:hypothetical protein GGF32_001772 [Allomyces javanicus]|nr:hypothetical protein GGF32_001772 [Allomyces javanicus]